MWNFFGKEENTYQSDDNSEVFDPEPELKPVVMNTAGSLKPFDSSVDDVDVWVLTFKAFLGANGHDPAKNDGKCRDILLATLGMQSCATLMSLIAPDKPSDQTLDELLQLVIDNFKPAPKAIAERFRLMGRKQHKGETVAQFLAELGRLAVTCKFKTDLELRLRDQFIFGLLSESAQRRLFTKEDDVTLKDVVAVAQAQETAELSTTLVRDGNAHQSGADQVNKVYRKSENTPRAGQSGSNHNKPSNPKRNNNPHQQNRKSCPNCASSSHTSPKDCPHKDAECFVCAKRGHFAKIVAVEEAQPQNHNNKINTAINLIETTMYHPFTLSEQVMMDKSTSRLRLPAFVTSWSSTPDARRVSSRDNSGINWVHRSSPGLKLHFARIRITNSNLSGN